MAITTLNNRSINRSDTASADQVWTATSATASDFQAAGGGTVLKVYTKMFAGGHSLSGTQAAGSPIAVSNYVSPTITPQSSSSKFVVQWTVSGNGGDNTFFYLARDIGGAVTKVGMSGSNLKNDIEYADWNSFVRFNATNNYPQKTLTIYDAPATASAIFYQLYYTQHGSTFYFGRSYTNSSSKQYSSLNSLIIWELDGTNITNTYETSY